MDNGIDLLNNDAPPSQPVMQLLVKIEEVLAACTTLKARVDIMEDHLVFLLSNSPKYLELLQKKASNNDNSETKPVL